MTPEAPNPTHGDAVTQSGGISILADVRVEGITLVPWSTPDVGTGRARGGRKYRFARKNRKLEAFQAAVRRFARAAMGGRPPHRGPCYLETRMVKGTALGALHGSWCCVAPGGATNARGDLTNLIKAVEDGLQGVIFLTDHLVCAGSHMVTWGPMDMVHARVYALDDILPHQVHGVPWNSPSVNGSPTSRPRSSLTSSTP